MSLCDCSCVLVATSDMVLKVKFHLFDLLDCLGVSLAQSIDDDGLEQDDGECDDDCYFHDDGSCGVNGVYNCPKTKFSGTVTG